MDETVVATTTSEKDDPVEALCLSEGLACFRGDPVDVLDRVHAAAAEHDADVVVRITGDCPVIDPEVIDQTVHAFLDSEPPVDLALNRFVDDRTFPIGLDTEVCSFAALDAAWKKADQPYQREHVMPYLYDPPGRFRVLHVRNDEDLRRLSLDGRYAGGSGVHSGSVLALCPGCDLRLAGHPCSRPQPPGSGGHERRCPTQALEEHR